MRMVAKAVFEARMHEITEENQAFGGKNDLAHNLEVVGSNPAPAIFRKAVDFIAGFFRF